MYIGYKRSLLDFYQGVSVTGKFFFMLIVTVINITYVNVILHVRDLCK